MFYRLFQYDLDNSRGAVPAKSHIRLFRESRAFDEEGNLAVYRNKRDTILMHVRGNENRFCGRIGRQATDREVTRYDDDEDVAIDLTERDDNIPNVSFLCIPGLSMIACEDGTDISSNSAMRRLHVILAHRQRAVFTFKQVETATDLTAAAKSFLVTRVRFEIVPVNPHSGDLGLKLDENNKKDNIGRMRGEVDVRDKKKSLRLDGGTLEAIEQLRASGHAEVGFDAQTKNGTLISVKKPKYDPEGPSEENSSPAAVRLSFSERPTYPYTQAHMQELEEIMKSFAPANRSR